MEMEKKQLGLIILGISIIMLIIGIVLLATFGQFSLVNIQIGYGYFTIFDIGTIIGVILLIGSIIIIIADWKYYLKESYSKN